MQNAAEHTNPAFKGGLLLLLTASLLGAFWPALQKLNIQWDNGDNSYGYLIVPLFIYLCWEKRDTFRFGEFSWRPWAVIPGLFTVSTVLFGELASVETMVYLGLWGAVVSIFLLLYGARVKHLVFPLLVLFFIIPLPPFINRLLTFKLKMAASTMSVHLLRWSGMSVLQEGNIIDLGISQLQVVDACSGLRYIMPMFLMALLVGHFFVRGWWRHAALVVFVIPLAVLINGLRIYLTGLLTVNGYEELAEGFFHDAAGLVMFLIAAVLLVGLALLLKQIGEESSGPQPVDPGGREVKPFYSAFLVLVLSSLFLGSGWLLQRLPQAQASVERRTFESFPMEIAGWQGSRSYLSKQILASLWADDYVNATFFRKNLANRIFLLIPFYEYQGTRHTVHAPQSCLLGGGWAILSTRDRTLAVDGGRIPLRTMLLGKDDNKMLANYFFFQRGRVLTSPWLNKFYLMYDAITRHRTDGALVRVEMTMAPGQSEEQAIEMVDGFMAGLWKVLPEYVPE